MDAANAQPIADPAVESSSSITAPPSRINWGLTPRRVFVFILVLDAALVLLALAVAFVPREATFTVDAITERLVLTLERGDPAPAWLTTANLAVPRGTAPLPCANAALDLGRIAPAKLVIALWAKQGSLHADLQTPDGAAGVLICDGREIGPPPASLSLTWNTTSPVSLAFGGHVRIGALPATGTLSSQLLKSGSLVVEASSVPFRSGRAHSEVALGLGDEVRLLAHGSGKDAFSDGVIRIEDDALHVVARSRADRAQIARIGQATAATAAVAPTFWDKLTAQSEWALVLFCCAVVLNLLTAAQAYVGDRGAGSGRP